MNNQDNYEGVYLTNGKSVEEWLNSFSSNYEKDLAEKAIDYCLRNGYQLSELKLRLTISSLSSTLPQKYIEPQTDTLSNGVPVIFIENRGRSYGCLVFTLLSIAFIVLAYFTNPAPEVHHEILTQRLTSIIIDETDKNGEENPLNIIIGRYFIDKAVSFILSLNLQYHDYTFFSTTSIVVDGRRRELSFGIFDKVYPIDSEIKRTIEELSTKHQSLK